MKASKTDRRRINRRIAAERQLKRSNKKHLTYACSLYKDNGLSSPEHVLAQT